MYTPDTINLPKDPFSYLPPDNTDYTMFAGKTICRFIFESQKYLPENAWWLAETCLQAYAEKQAGIDGLKEAFVQFKPETDDFVEFVEEPTLGTDVYVVRCKEFNLVVFRGSEVLSRKNLTWHQFCDGFKDWVLTDANAVQRKWKGHFVHCGFADAYDRVRAGLYKALQVGSKPYLTKKLLITGHSLGGAIATLCAADLWLFEKTHKRPDAIYTFGSPFVVGKELGDRLDELTIFRIVNGVDLVARVPITDNVVGGRPYRHVGTFTHISSTGTSVSQPRKDPPQLADLINSMVGLLPQMSSLAPILFAGDLANLVPRPISDHAPRCYSTHLWNNWVKDWRRRN